LSLILGKEYGGIYEGWELIADVVLTTAASSITISGLDGDRDEIYLFVCYWKGSPTAAWNLFDLQPNNVSLNLNTQYLIGDGTSLSAGTLSVIRLGGPYDTEEDFCVCMFYAKSGKQRRCVWARSVRTTIIEVLNAGLWNNTTDNITSFVIVSSTTNGMAAGTRVLLFRKRS